MSKIIKITITLIVLVALGGGLYWYSGSRGNSGAISSTLSSESATGETAPMPSAVELQTKEILALLEKIKSITLSSEIVATDAFLSLHDNTRVIPLTEIPGRPNPFAPIGTDIGVKPTPALQLPVPTPIPTPPPSSPVKKVETLPISSLTKNSTVLNGNLLASKSGTTRFFEWGTTAGALTNYSPSVTQATTGNFSYTTQGLSSGATYYVRAVAIIDGVRMTGDILSFTTLK